MTDLTLRAVQALTAWGGSDAPPRLISHRENAVFEVVLKTGERAALRLHRPGYVTRNDIVSELVWAQGLHTAGSGVPTPVPTTAGDLVHSLPDGQNVSVISWLDGTPIGAGETPLAGTLADQIALYTEVGKTLAQLHTATDALILPPDFSRPSWDIDGFLGPNPLWGRFWEHPMLDEDDRELLQVARMMARSSMKEYLPKADFGLIHADALRENILATDKGLSLIDFDDSGFGFRLYDITTALTQSLEDENLPDLYAAIVEGYDSLRPLSPEDRAMMPLFSMMRSFASLGWIVPRLPDDHPKIPVYFDRALSAAEAFMDGYDFLAEG